MMAEDAVRAYVESLRKHGLSLPEDKKPKPGSCEGGSEVVLEVA